MIAQGYAQILVRTADGWRWRLVDAGGRLLVCGLASSRPAALRAVWGAIEGLRGVRPQGPGRRPF